MLKMIGNWEISSLSITDRFFEYSQAYLEACIVICREMSTDERKRSWPNASVTLMLAVHSTELFIKGAILFRKPDQKINSHRLMELKTIYDKLFPEEEFSWELPFKTEYIGISKEEAATLSRSEPVPSILFRYPVDLQGTDWKGVHGFIPDDFLKILIKLEIEYERIRGALGNT